MNCFSYGPNSICAHSNLSNGNNFNSNVFESQKDYERHLINDHLSKVCLLNVFEPNRDSNIDRLISVCNENERKY